LKVVRQPQHAQFVVYSVPDDVAATFDCERRLSPAGARKPARAYGNYFGAMFTIRGHQDHRVALLWAREEGYWKIVSWLTGTDEAAMPVPVVAATSRVVRIKADPSFTEAARTFLESWLIRKAAFRVLSPASYACYDLERSPEAPAATSPEDAGRRVRQAIERVGTWVGTARTLDDVLVAPEPLHPSIRVMDHPYSRTFSLMAVPNALGDPIECDARARGVNVPEPLPLEYGNAFGMMLRFSDRGRRRLGVAIAVAQTGECVADHRLRRRGSLMKSMPRRDRGVRSAGGSHRRTRSSAGGRVKGHRR
jgi:hypothetical protein